MTAEVYEIENVKSMEQSVHVGSWLICAPSSVI